MNRMKRNKLIIAPVLAIILLTGSLMMVFAKTEHFTDAAGTAGKNTWKDWANTWENVKINLEKISLTPGVTPSQLNFCWYSHTATDKPAVKWSNNINMTNAKIFSGTQSPHRIINGTPYYSSKVTVSGLAEHHTYYYQYENNGVWSNPISYSTQSFSKCKFIFVGDPQIGASVGRMAAEGKEPQSAEIAARNDTYNWNATLSTALNAHPGINFILSAGDQINYTPNDETPQQELEYSGYLSPEILKSLPVATVIGNHDSKTTNYKNHFNNPNSFTEESNPSPAGNGYFFKYGSALFIIINTNNYNCADHELLIKKALKTYPDVNWKVLAFHHDIYGSGKDHSDSDGIILRTQLTPLIDKYHIDVVLQGHDHTYSRTYPLTGDNRTHTSYSTAMANTAIKWDDEENAVYQAQNRCYTVIRNNFSKITNPKGTVYITANSATGSKYYDLINSMQDYVAARWQEWKPTYSLIEVTDNSFTVSTYETETGKTIDSPYTIIKTATSKTRSPKSKKS